MENKLACFMSTHNNYRNEYGNNFAKRKFLYLNVNDLYYERFQITLSYSKCVEENLFEGNFLKV